MCVCEIDTKEYDKYVRCKQLKYIEKFKTIGKLGQLYL